MSIENNLMTHEIRLARVEGVEPASCSVQLRSSDPTPMSTNDTPTQRRAESHPNDQKYLNGSAVTEKIAAHLEKRATSIKSWFKARHVADAIDENSRVVGPAMAAMYRSDQYPEVVERRSADDCWVYRVEVDR